MNHAWLDERGGRGHPLRVKLMRFVFLLTCLCGLVGTGLAQVKPPPLAPLPKVPKEADAPPPVAAPPDVIASAVAAVASLGDEVVLGRYQVAIERMNPLWKERTANRMGGMQELEKQLAGVARMMLQEGISMISFKPQGQPTSFEIGTATRVGNVNGVEQQKLVADQWLVLVPTATKFRIQQKDKPRIIEGTGFQVAVSDKDKLNWTFIDGSNLTVNDLRGLYFTLPRDLQLPPVEKHEVR